MKKLKAFWYVYKKSLFDVNYYKDILKIRRDFSLKYFFTLALFASVIATARFAIPNVPKIKDGMNSLITELSTMYPDDLVITSEAGMWEINKPEPYVIPNPDIFEVEEQTDFPKNLVVFDHNGTIDDLEEMDTFVVVNKVNMITVNSQNRVEAYPLDSIPDGELNKAVVLEAMDGLRKLTKFVPVMIISFIIIATLFYFAIFRLAYAFIVALLLLAYGNLKGVKSTLGTYYKIAIHTMTLPLTIELMFILIKAEVGYTLWFFGFNLIFGIVVIQHLVNTKAFKEKK